MNLSTHVLDTMHGIAGRDMEVLLFAGERLLMAGRTDDNGRCPALDDLPLAVGRFRLEFGVADYFRGRGVMLPEPPFLDRISIAFGIASIEAHLHVPLLVSPYSYTTYRGN